MRESWQGWHPPTPKTSWVITPVIDAACGTSRFVFGTLARTAPSPPGGGTVPRPVVSATATWPSAVPNVDPPSGSLGTIPQVRVDEVAVFDVNTGPTPPLLLTCVIVPVCRSTHCSVRKVGGTMSPLSFGCSFMRVKTR